MKQVIFNEEERQTLSLEDLFSDKEYFIGAEKANRKFLFLPSLNDTPSGFGFVDKDSVWDVNCFSDCPYEALSNADEKDYEIYAFNTLKELLDWFSKKGTK